MSGGLRGVGLLLQGNMMNTFNINRIALQEEKLQFDRFDTTTAWALTFNFMGSHCFSMRWRGLHLTMWIGFGVSET